MSKWPPESQSGHASHRAAARCLRLKAAPLTFLARNRSVATKGEAALAETAQQSSRFAGDLTSAKRESEALMQARGARGVAECGRVLGRPNLM